MDLHRHIRLLWRSKLVVLGGAVIGILLGILAGYKVSGSGLEVRKAPVYTSTTKLLVTQNGFPWGRTALPGEVTAGVSAGDAAASQSAKSNDASVTFADPGRLATLAWMYSHFVMSDEVRALVKNPPEDMTIDAAPLTAGGNFSSPALPVIQLTITAGAASEAQRLSREVPSALETFLTKGQNASKTSAGDRVEVSVINRSPMAVPEKSKAMLMSIVIFMMAVAAAIALAYILENLRLSSRWVETLPDRRPENASELPMPKQVRSAADHHHGADAGWASGPPSTQNRFSSSSR